ncbi:hypothetical protein L226DRAFT_393265 [Lentinus tigrinus ALCF2SS1-7]|uniref:uncharacterized protein n=1 Tax=Lentinus tigrinus ALCF2SS1-7 TaxID=1328758 RepID=UPI001165F4D5|nr:hypothetical protein L226DRAFT_393265 [Lentinus tigrinus ALCF2SS1-7]
MAATLPYHSSLRPRTCVLPAAALVTSRPHVPSPRHLSPTQEPLRLLCPDMTAEQARQHPTGETGVVPSELVTMALYVDSQGVSPARVLAS